MSFFKKKRKNWPKLELCISQLIKANSILSLKNSINCIKRSKKPEKIKNSTPQIQYSISQHSTKRSSMKEKCMLTLVMMNN